MTALTRSEIEQLLNDNVDPDAAPEALMVAVKNVFYERMRQRGKISQDQDDEPAKKLAIIISAMADGCPNTDVIIALAAILASICRHSGDAEKKAAAIQKVFGEMVEAVSSS